MAIELSDEIRNESIASIQMYFLEERQEEMGNIAAGAVLDFILEEIGPSLYNRAVRVGSHSAPVAGTPRELPVLSLPIEGA